MRVVLKITSGSYAGRSVLLQRGQSIKVGRTEWADFVISVDDRMSGEHFWIGCEGSGCRVRDLDSTNGTYVNNSRVTEVDLHDGDLIVAGRTNFQVTVEITESVSDLSTILPAVHVAPESSAGASDVTVAEQVSVPTAPDPRRSAVLKTVSDSALALALVSDAQRPYSRGLQDADPDVRREALYAAAWTGQQWLLEYCRCLARQPTPENWEALQLLAILGQPADLEFILTIGRTKRLGSRRFAAYAAFGHPHVVRDLLVAMENKDPNTAVAAGVAFTKITGADIESDQRVKLAPEDGSQPDEFEQEFLDEAFLPCPQRANAHWNKVKDAFAIGLRWRRGIDISHPQKDDILHSLDMEAQWQVKLRGAYEGW